MHFSGNTLPNNGFRFCSFSSNPAMAAAERDYLGGCDLSAQIYPALSIDATEIIGGFRREPFKDKFFL
jgi:hypothetical protein